MVLLALLHGAVLAAAPSAPLVALGMWWNANTIAHQSIHRPFFRARAANRLFSAYLSAVLGIPQTLWRDRHLAHHTGHDAAVRWSPALALDTIVVIAVWAAIAASDARFFATVYLPGYAAGLLLCWMHGHYEHVRGVTSHYGVVYNVLFFNDGYHVEHHAHPGRHWSELPRYRDAGADTSRWPAALRWMEGVSLQGLERLVLRSPLLERFVVAVHARAIRTLLAATRDVRRITIVGGGLFPRTAMILRRLLPEAAITIVDANAAHLEIARRRLNGANVRFVHERWVSTGSIAAETDLVVFPLSFDGDRHAIYARPPARWVLVHDWIWRRRGASRVVSPLLLKRVNLVRSD